MTIRVRWGPLLLCLCVALYRAGWLSVQLSGFQVAEAGYLLLADVPVLGLLMILVWVESVTSRPWTWVTLAAIVAITIVYLADAAAVLSLNARLQVQDVQRFASEWWLLPGYLNLMTVGLLVVVVAALALRYATPRRMARSLAAVGAAVLLVALLIPRDAVPSHLQKYAGSVLLVATELRGRTAPITEYRPADLTTLQRGHSEFFDAPIARTRRNIVLVMVESLSAADSYRTSGLRNVLGRFDELSREGMLFRNFVANFEASEGGIVAMLSGVPPLHFPTATTDTFREYSLQPSMVETFRQNGYRCEFLTNVPLQFISMDFYATSRTVGFTHAAGKHEIARYAGAPTYAFESPADHLLYEEVLARLDERQAGSPAFIAAITASSHTPYVDPRGREPREAHVWEYVQEELWWLYGELQKRRFFDDGLLVITGDHRKMLPVGQAERDRYGDSAKARVPLLVIGRDVPRDHVDDRFFAQSDLLRMLDRAVQPGRPLSPWALWVGRYMYVFGIASNAGNAEVLHADDLGRHAFRLSLRGAEILWLDRPVNALEIEHAIHRQRATQQFIRAARTSEDPITAGRELQPAADRPGVLIGLSTDANIGRDPDDPAGSLRTFDSDTFVLNTVLARTAVRDGPFTMSVRGFMQIAEPGEYWFSMFADDRGCLAIAGKSVLGCRAGVNEGVVHLDAGRHRFDLRYLHLAGTPQLRLRWLPPGAATFEPFPEGTLLAPIPAQQ